MAYADEKNNCTTLLEGSIKLLSGEETRIIKPGQQAITSSRLSGIKVTEVDTDEAIAWKNGNFNFQGVDIQTLMRQISRWYNVEVVYKGYPPPNKFVGTIPRSPSINEVIKILELNHVKVQVIDQKIIVVSIHPHSHLRERVTRPTK